MKIDLYRRCTRCLYDTTIPNIKFDEEGVCEYCKIHDQMEKEYPTGHEGLEKLRELSEEIKKDGKGKMYDVVVGVSGGCDSSYLLYTAKQYGLRCLAVHFDNGWNTEVAKKNMAIVCESLQTTLYTVSVDREEFNDICLSFLKSGVGDLDIANDIGLTEALYRAADLFDVKHIFIGHSFRTEGIAPIGWTYMDGKYISEVHKKYGTMPMKTFPNLWLKNFVKYALKGIKRHRPLYYVEYNKEVVKKMLSEKLGWQWYGGHHMENKYTAFEVADILPKRYGIDMRLLGHSALVRSGQLDREEALEDLREPVDGSELAEEVRKRLGVSKREFERFYTQPKVDRSTFKSYRRTFKLMKPFWWLMYKLNRIPKSFYIKYAK